jgi:hypothetical protein
MKLVQTVCCQARRNDADLKCQELLNCLIILTGNKSGIFSKTQKQKLTGLSGDVGEAKFPMTKDFFFNSTGTVHHELAP